MRPEAAGALARFWDDRYARCRVVVDRATARGELPGPADARALLVAATAPLYHELLLLRAGPDPALPSRCASAAAAAGRAGAYRTGPPASTRCHG
ncbi:TetR-like C-terminal domain-containing protein [Streptomyces sp. NPDC058874]|uniref:TetR-like C-terminal domain-containing protein n=1 Tax=unclassified Streptomyces TaxID=2593676 RepID=UPI0036B6CF95